MPQMPVWRPFGELDLCDELRLEPHTVLHLFLGQGPLGSLPLGQISERAFICPKLFDGTLNDYRLKPVGSDATESRGTRLKPSEVFPAQSRLKARWAL